MAFPAQPGTYMLTGDDERSEVIGWTDDGAPITVNGPHDKTIPFVVVHPIGRNGVAAAPDWGQRSDASELLRDVQAAYSAGGELDDLPVVGDRSQAPEAAHAIPQIIDED